MCVCVCVYVCVCVCVCVRARVCLTCDSKHTAAIQSLYYRRAVYGWDEGLDYVFYLDNDVTQGEMNGVGCTCVSMCVRGRRGRGERKGVDYVFYLDDDISRA